MSQSVQAIAPTLAVVDGKPTTTSLEVARHFNRPHGEVMRRIRTLLEQLPADHQCNFALMLSDVAIGSGATRQDPAYRITRDGFTLLAMGFTGKKALAFKLAYIDAFNRMEAELSKPTRPMLTMKAPQPDANLMRTAVLTALACAAMVQRQVAASILNGGDTWKHERWVVSFVTDSKFGSPPIVDQLKPTDCILSQELVSKMFADASVTAWHRVLGDIRTGKASKGAAA